MSNQLFDGLLDDAAVFPPAALPLGEALRQHAQHRRSEASPMIGPMLLPAAWCEDGLAGTDESMPPRLGLICRPGDDTQVIARAVDALRSRGDVEVSGIEQGWSADWRGTVVDGFPLALEVPRGDPQEGAIVDIARARQEGWAVVAKFRTGPTAAWAWPDEGELARFVLACVAHDVPFKLTGGLHHAVRGAYPVADGLEDNHGALNILLGVADALAGARPEDIEATLGERDAQAIGARVAGLSPLDRERIRDVFTSYGCCTVTDPLDEFGDLGLLDPGVLAVGARADRTSPADDPAPAPTPEGAHDDVA